MGDIARLLNLLEEMEARGVMIEKMLRSQLLSGNNLHWVGGYVHGRTEPKAGRDVGDPFVLLFPAADYLEFHVCRVYPEAWNRLPSFISTDVPEKAPTENMKKSAAIEAGIYHRCAPFQIVTYDGRETPAGREKRFGGILMMLPDAAPTNGRRQLTSGGREESAQAPKSAPSDDYTAGGGDDSMGGGNGAQGRNLGDDGECDGPIFAGGDPVPESVHDAYRRFLNQSEKRAATPTEFWTWKRAQEREGNNV